MIINFNHAGFKEPCPYGKEGEPPNCQGELFEVLEPYI